MNICKVRLKYEANYCQTPEWQCLFVADFMRCYARTTMFHGFRIHQHSSEERYFLRMVQFTEKIDNKPLGPKFLTLTFASLFNCRPPLNVPSAKKLIQARLGVSKTIYVNVCSPNLGFPYSHQIYCQYYWAQLTPPSFLRVKSSGWRFVIPQWTFLSPWPNLFCLLTKLDRNSSSPSIRFLESTMLILC